MCVEVDSLGIRQVSGKSHLLDRNACGRSGIDAFEEATQLYR